MKNDYYNDKESVDRYTEMAKDMNGSALIEKLKSFLPAGSSVLEIGSGPGTDWKILKRDYLVTGSDYSSEFLKRLIALNPGGNFLELDAISLNTELKFNAIYSNKVLHHLKDKELNQSIKRQAEILKPHGIICHSFWKGKGSEIFNGLFVNNHTEEDLLKFFKDKFDILLIEHYPEFEKDDSLLLIAKKK